ncbi:MAG: glycosyltransferase, partial [Schleiferiaceae bacterium]|nr:glycosyltransferase [Schleiferiaceae bacterium]
MRYSLISPTFKRPDEVSEFIASIAKLSYPREAFEVILGDGTPGDALRPIIKRVADDVDLPVKVVYQEFLPVSDARNLAAAAAEGDVLIFLDSDCLLPKDYLNKVDLGLTRDGWDAFGGPDAAPSDFSHLQKAINYSMTSPLTTGGIRGGKQSTSTYYPRGFNMGMKAKVFKAVKGYDTAFKCGEDVELSIRINEAGYKVGLIPEAVVWHKRRSNLGQFYKQVRRFGSARIALARQHKGQMKATHAFPAVFMFTWVAAFALHVTQVFT